MARVAYCQQWDVQKGTFVAHVMRVLPRPHVILAWIAVESGGSALSPRGADFNFLQIKDKGSKGQTDEGFAIYANATEAAKAARRRIRNEPGIMRARKKSVDELLRAIANAWNDASGITVGKVPEGYYNALKEKYDCIKSEDIIAGGFLGIRAGFGDEGKVNVDTPDEVRAALEFAKDPADKIGGWVGDLLEGLWPILLKTALAGTGLALIVYGVKGLFGSTAAESTAKVAPVAAGTAKAVA